MTGSAVVEDTATLTFGSGAGFGTAESAGAITLGNGTMIIIR